MKNLLALVALIFSLSSFAQTRIEVTPLRPVSCRVANYPLVNWIYELKKVEENRQAVVYEFITQYGSCVNGEVVATAVSEENASVGVLQDDFLLPWQKEGAKGEAQQISATELRVTLTFDKKILFKKKVLKTLTMSYRPGVKYGPVYLIRNRIGGLETWQADLQFPWKIELSVDEVFDTQIKIMM